MFTTGPSEVLTSLLLLGKRRGVTLFLGDGPHHEVHAGGVGLAAQLEGTQLTLQALHVVQDPLQLRLAAAELLQHKVVDLLHIARLEVCRLDIIVDLFK